jgi:hypothetical protein
MNHSFGELVVTLAGRNLVDVWDRLCRYCGLAWSGGAPETWAFAYYDTISAAPDGPVTPVDVTATAALHPGLSRADLAFFAEHTEALSRWLERVPVDVPLHELDDATVEHIAGLAAWDESPGISLMSKVLHRKRPDAIPLLDRHIIDLYRPVTGERSASLAYPAIVRAMRADLLAGAASPLELMRSALERETGRHVSLLRLADIAIWMGVLR